MENKVIYDVSQPIQQYLKEVVKASFVKQIALWRSKFENFMKNFIKKSFVRWNFYLISQ